jgi:CheY-like chemotaxis protein
MKPLRKVLVVDDDPVVGRSFDRTLSNKGYAVVTAADGAEALAKIAAEDYDVVYTDIRMPGMDGIEVAANIKGRRPWLPVVIVSGYATPENEARAKAVGVTAVLHKPLSPEMIEDSAREALREIERITSTKTVEPEAPAVAPSVAPAPRKIGPLATIGLFLAAPFIGLAYVTLFPIVGLFALVGMGVWAAMKRLAERVSHFGTFSRNVGLFLAAPFIGLAYVIVFPFVGLGMLVWHGGKALFGRARAH